MNLLVPGLLALLPFLAAGAPTASRNSYDLLIIGGRVVDGTHYSEGIRFVVVNGQLVVDGGRLTDARLGRVLTRSGAPWPGSPAPGADRR